MNSIGDLTDEEQVWLSKAVASIILADGEVDKNEIVFMKKLARVVPEKSALETLCRVAKQSKHSPEVKLDPIQVKNIDNLIFMLDILAASVFANGKKLQEETTLYFEAGKKLGVIIGTLSYRLSIEAEKHRVMRKLEKIRKSIKTDPTHTLVEQANILDDN